MLTSATREARYANAVTAAAARTAPIAAATFNRGARPIILDRAVCTQPALATFASPVQRTGSERPATVVEAVLGFVASIANVSGFTRALVRGFAGTMA